MNWNFIKIFCDALKTLLLPQYMIMKSDIQYFKMIMSKTLDSTGEMEDRGR